MAGGLDRNALKSNDRRARPQKRSTFFNGIGPERTLA
jgi:hypothetical protein